LIVATLSVPRLSCGVALCTYNGLPYLQQQLQSLLAQQRLPDHIAIFDDDSTDGTWAFLNDWAKEVCVPVSLHQNAIRQGVAKNFEAATRALDTDLIFLCDQDDIWLPDKIDVLAKVFEAEPDVLLVHTDAQLVDGDARDLKMSMFKALGLSNDELKRMHSGDAFAVLCRRNLVTGATAAFRRSLLELAQPFPAGWLHDEWLAVLAAAKGKVVLMEVSLIQYRQHGRNVVGISAPSLWHSAKRFWQLLFLPVGEFQRQRAARASVLLERLRAQPTLPSAYLILMQGAFAHASFRSSLPKNPVRRFYAVLDEARTGRYQRFSSGLPDIIRDLLQR